MEFQANGAPHTRSRLLTTKLDHKQVEYLKRAWSKISTSGAMGSQDIDQENYEDSLHKLSS